MNKIEVKQKIDDYFSKEIPDSKQTKKIMALAMSQRIRLGKHRKRFCKKCYSDLSKSKIKISKTYKNVVCNVCGMKSRWKL
jgi:RNase P subunit RPR2